VVEAIETRESAQGHRIFAGSGCRFIEYQITAKESDVDLDGFFAATKDESRGAKKHAVTCAPKNESSDYHLHVNWYVFDSDFRLAVEFCKGPIPHAADEHEPYAEQFIQWVDRFFAVKVHTAEVEADFRYPLSKRRCRFPLPIKANIGPGGSEATVDGISFATPANPEGVSKVYLTQGSQSTTIHLRARRPLDFTTFDPQTEVAALDQVASAVLQEEKQ